MWTSLIASFLILLTNSHINVRSASSFFYFSWWFLTVVNTNNLHQSVKGQILEEWSLSLHCIILYNRETHDGQESVYTYIISPIILSFSVKYSDGTTPTSPLWVNIALSWMRSLMHTASSGKTVYASTCHLGLCVFVCSALAQTDMASYQCVYL